MWTKKLFKNDDAVGTSVQAGLIIPIAALLVFGTALTSLATPNASELTKSVDYDAIDAASQIMNKLEGPGFASSGDGSDWHNADSSEKVEDPGLESSDERESTSSIPIEEEGSDESEDVDTPDTDYEVTFLVVDSTDESPISGAMIRIAGLQDSTNSEGIAVFEVDPDCYSYRVLAAGYVLGMGAVDVSEDVTVKVGLSPSAANNAPIIHDMDYSYGVYDDTNLELIVTVTAWVYEPDGDSPISYEIDWGDGSSTTIGSIALGDSSSSMPSGSIGSVSETSSISDIQELQEYSMVNGYINQYGTSGSIPSDSVLINEEHTYTLNPMSIFGEEVISYTIDLTVSDPAGLTDSEDLYISYIYDDDLEPYIPPDPPGPNPDPIDPVPVPGCWCAEGEFGYGGYWSSGCSCPVNSAASNTQQTSDIQMNTQATTGLLGDYNAGVTQTPQNSIPLGGAQSSDTGI